VHTGADVLYVCIRKHEGLAAGLVCWKLGSGHDNEEIIAGMVSFYKKLSCLLSAKIAVVLWSAERPGKECRG
jgi:hypothetical protein